MSARQRPGAYTISSAHIATALAARTTGRPVAWLRRWWQR